MGLQVWLPLNGNLNNQGLMDVTATNNGATIDNNGKIGKCYSFDGSDDFINLGSIGSFFDGSAFSICFWIYSLENTTRAAVFSSYGLSSTSNFFGLELNSSNGSYCNNNLRFDWLGSDTYSPADFITYNAWTHVCVTYDGINKINMYKNGELIQTSTRALNSITVGNNYYLGRDSRTGTTAFNGKLNDFRIYDHCLSPREVKEISKGLVLHYPLSMPGQENLTPCGGIYTQINPRTTTFNRVDGNAWIPNSAFEGTPSTTYTISVQCDGTLSNAHSPGGLSPSDKPWSFWLYICNIDTSKQWQAGQYDTPVNLNSSNHNYRKIGNTHVWTYTLSSTQKYISLRTNSYSDGTTNVTVNWWNIKVEKGDTFTPWIPNASSELYTSLGFNDGIEYDVSGYNHNGTKVGSITYDADTPRYETSAVFPNNCNTYIYTDGLKQQMFTWACWFKILGSGATTSQRIISEGRDAGSRGAEIWASKDGTTLSYFAHGGGGSTVISLNTWYHIAMVCDGNNRIVYLNGNQIHSGTYTADIDYAQSNNAFVVGKMAYAYTQSSAYFPLNGQVSDVRIYATAISADDILELYHTPISLSNNGTLLTQGEYVES